MNKPTPKSKPRRLYLPALIGIAVVLVFAALSILSSDVINAAAADKPSAEVRLCSDDVHVDCVATRENHTIYKYSIHPGGVWSSEEAGLVGGYSSILKEDMHAYVNYFRNGRIYWTRHPIVIRAGEMIITDGETTIRSRCGNTISFTPQVPTEPTDIAPLLDEPVTGASPGVVYQSSLYPNSPTGLPPVGLGPNGGVIGSGSPTNPPIVGTPTIGNRPHYKPPVKTPPLVPVPEPATYASFAIGALLVYKMRRTLL